jgi:integrase
MPSNIYSHGKRFRVEKMRHGNLVRRTFRTLEEAQAFLDMLERDAEDARSVRAANLTGAATVKEVVDLWWLGPLVDGEHRGGHRARVSALTARNYQYYIDAYIARIGDQSAQAYARNTALLKLFYDTLPNRCAWHVHGVLRMAFRDAVTRGLIDRNPCEIEKPAKRKRRKRMIPTRTEVEKIVVGADEQDGRWGLFVYLTATLGTRCGETVALRAEDFDEASHVVRIERAVTKTARRPTIKEPKSGEPRELPIDDPDFWNRVRPHIASGGFLFPGYYRDAPRTASAIKPWHPDHAQKRFRTLVTSLGLTAYTLHSLRHFVATQLLIEGQPINQVAEFLGHSPQMTLMLYGRHLDHEAMRRVGRAATSLVDVAIGPPAAGRPVVDRVEADALILELSADGPLTNAAVQHATGLTRRQVTKALDRLVKTGRLERRGTKRGTHYVTS